MSTAIPAQDTLGPARNDTQAVVKGSAPPQRLGVIRALGLAARYRWTAPDVLFVVYGNKRHQNKVWPAPVRRFMEMTYGRVLPMGEMVFRGGKLGLVVATTYTTEQLLDDPWKAITVTETVERLFAGVTTVALAGSLPGLIHRVRPNYQWGSPFLSGNTGTRYGMLKSALKGAEKARQPASDLTITIIGVGFTGKGVVTDCSQHFGKVYALDPRFNNLAERFDDGNITCTADPACLAKSDIAMVFTRVGDEIQNCIGHMGPGLIVIDDTHPEIGFRLQRKILARGVDLQKAVLRLRDPAGREDFEFWPELPDFDRHSVPGCLAEAMAVRLSPGGMNILNDPAQFAKAADELGFQADLIPHPIPKF